MYNLVHFVKKYAFMGSNIEVGVENNTMIHTGIPWELAKPYGL